MTNGKPPAPPRITVDEFEEYWTQPPPKMSDRCAWWLRRIGSGWRPGRRIGGEGYYGSAMYYGVYIWEWLNVLSPTIQEAKLADARATSASAHDSAATAETVSSDD